MQFHEMRSKFMRIVKQVKKKKDDVVIEQDATVHETDDGLFVSGPQKMPD